MPVDAAKTAILLASQLQELADAKREAGLVMIVCGGRDFNDSHAVCRALDHVHAKREIRKILHGGAKGADSLAHQWATTAGVEVEVFAADWASYGKRAGPKRNQAMADTGADGCIAFPGGRGTADMIRRAEAARIPVWAVDHASAQR